MRFKLDKDAKIYMLKLLDKAYSQKKPFEKLPQNNK